MATLYRFRDFVLEGRTKPVLYQSGKRIDADYIPLKFLQVLLDAGGEIVSNEALERAIWPEETATKIYLKARFDQAVKRLRDLLGDDRDVIKNIRGNGYFVDARVHREEDDDLAALATQTDEVANSVATVPVPAPGAQENIEYPPERERLSFAGFPDIDKAGTLAKTIRAWRAKGIGTWHRLLADLFRAAADDWTRVTFLLVLIQESGIGAEALLPDLTKGQPEDQWDSDTRVTVELLRRAQTVAVAKLKRFMALIDDMKEGRQWLMNEVIRLLKATDEPTIDYLRRALPEAQLEFGADDLIELATSGRPPEQWDTGDVDLVRRIRDGFIPYACQEWAVRQEDGSKPDMTADVQVYQAKVDELLARRPTGRSAQASGPDGTTAPLHNVDTTDKNPRDLELIDINPPYRFDDYPEFDGAPALAAVVKAWRVKGFRKWRGRVMELLRKAKDEKSRVVVLMLLAQIWKLRAADLLPELTHGQPETEWDDSTRAEVQRLVEAEAQTGAQLRHAASVFQDNTEGRKWFMEEVLRVLESSVSPDHLRQRLPDVVPIFGHKQLIAFATAGQPPEEWSEQTEMVVRRIRDHFIPYWYKVTTEGPPPKHSSVVHDWQQEVDELLQRVKQARKRSE